MGKRKIVWWYEQTTTEIYLDRALKGQAGKGLDYARSVKTKYDSGRSSQRHVNFTGYERKVVLSTKVKVVYRRTIDPQEIDEMLEVNSWWDALTTLNPLWLWDSELPRTPFHRKYKKSFSQITEYIDAINKRYAIKGGKEERSFAFMNAEEDIDYSLRWQKEALVKPIYKNATNERIYCLFPSGKSLEVKLCGGKYDGPLKFFEQDGTIEACNKKSRILERHDYSCHFDSATHGIDKLVSASVRIPTGSVVL